MTRPSGLALEMEIEVTQYRACSAVGACCGLGLDLDYRANGSGRFSPELGSLRFSSPASHPLNCARHAEQVSGCAIT